MELNFSRLLFLLMFLSILNSAAEDWLNPSIVLEVFEARSARMSVECAKKLSKFTNQEEGMSTSTWMKIDLSEKSVFILLVILFLLFLFVLFDQFARASLNYHLINPYMTNADLFS